VQRLSPPERVDHDRHPGRTTHPDDLAGPGEQPFKIARRGRPGLNPEERELPGIRIISIARQSRPMSPFRWYGDRQVTERQLDSNLLRRV